MASKAGETQVVYGRKYRLIRRYQRRLAARVFAGIGCSSYAASIEEGDLIVESEHGRLYRAEASSGADKRAAGDLTPRLIRPPLEGLRAIRVGDDIWWAEEKEEIT